MVPTAVVGAPMVAVEEKEEQICEDEIVVSM